MSERTVRKRENKASISGGPGVSKARDILNEYMDPNFRELDAKILNRGALAHRVKIPEALLADNIIQGPAGPDEFRTVPLWGVGKRIFFLHDGRTNDLLQAILAHADNDNNRRDDNNQGRQLALGKDAPE